MRTPPLEVIRSWPAPNFENPETRGPANEIVASILLAFVTILVAIRIYTRKWMTNGFGWDDVLIILAYIPATAFAIAGIIADQKFGWGKHVWDNKPDVFIPGLKLAISSHILFDLGTSLTKLSMLALVYRIACASSRKLRITVIVLAAFISVNCVAFILITLLQCRPLSLYWTLSFEPQNCISEAQHLLMAGTINTVTDFIVVALPMAVVYHLHKHELSRRQLVMVNLLFAAGFIVSLAGAARTYFTWVMNTSSDFDTTWHAWLTWLMSSVELHLGIICASIPATKPFFSRYVPRLLATNSQRRVTEITNKTTKGVYTARSSEDRHSIATFGDVDSLASPFQMPEVWEMPKRLTSDLNKPLPAIKQSIYTIPIRLDDSSVGTYDRSSNYSRPSSTDRSSRSLSEIFVPQGRWKHPGPPEDQV